MLLRIVYNMLQLSDLKSDAKKGVGKSLSDACCIVVLGLSVPTVSPSRVSSFGFTETHNLKLKV